MILEAPLSSDLARRAADLRAAGTPHAIATVVRTSGATAAKAGARAIVSAEGEILEGWVGGGCARGAIRRATLAALESGAPVFVALRPEEALAELGVGAGETRDGIVHERNGCPSKGHMDLFVEPVTPAPVLAILGDGPVAQALMRLARGFDFEVSAALPEPASAAYIVVATQGRGDRAALADAVATGAPYIAFVGSRRKFETLAGALAEAGTDRAALDAVVAPAGLRLGAANSEEIALSILAQITAARRGGDLA